MKDEIYQILIIILLIIILLIQVLKFCGNKISTEI